VSGPNRSATESVIASDGTRVAVAWNEDEIDVRKLGKPGMIANNRTSIHAVVIGPHGELADAAYSDPPPGQHDWVQAMTWDGCQFALVHTNGINASSMPARTVSMMIAASAVVHASDCRTTCPGPGRTATARARHFEAQRWHAARYRPRAILEVFRERRYSQPDPARAREDPNRPACASRRSKPSSSASTATSADCGRRSNAEHPVRYFLAFVGRDVQDLKTRMTALELAGRTP